MVQKTDQKAEYPHAGLPLPPRIDQEKNFFHQPAAVNEWLTKLPLASPLECAKLLFKSLFEMNRINLDSEVRINILEELLKPVESVVSNLKSKYATTTFPLSDKNRKIALLTRELLKEVVIGYKTAIAEQIDSGSAKSRQNLHIIAVHRAITYLHRVLMHSYMIYEPHPANIWREMHLLFTYSSINKIDRIPVRDEQNESAASTTVKKVYLKTLLLAAASPYQLRQRETETLSKELDKICSLAKLSIRHVHDSDNDIGFLINLHSDKPPVPLSYAPKQENRQLFVLDTRKILENVQDSLVKEDSDNQLNLSQHLKKLLLRNWGHAPHRQYVRTRLNFDLNLAIGLNEIHELLESGQENQDKKSLYLGRTDSVRKSRDNLQRSSMFSTEAEDEDITVLTLDYNDRPDKNVGTFLSSQRIDKELQINADELMSISNDDIQKRTHECKTINESSGGYCIEWPHGNAPKIRVGEIIGIQSTTQAVEFGIAITRWLKNLSAETLLVGIEIISHSCKAVKVRTDQLVPKHMQVTYYPGLTLPQTSDSPEFLITPSDLFKEEAVLLVKNQLDIQERVKLTRLVESTGLFSQYETSMLSSSGKASSGDSIETPSAFT